MAVPRRINCGGGAYTDPQGRVWAADSGFTPLSGTWSTNTAIANNSNTGQLMQSHRFASGANFLEYDLYNFPAGDYSVTLYWAEIYDGITAPGQRRANIFVGSSNPSQKTEVEPSFDVFQLANGRYIGLNRTYRVHVEPDGFLWIWLGSLANNAFVSGIEIADWVQPTGTLRINCGGPQLTIGGNVWAADYGFNGGFVFATSNNIENDGGLNTVYQTSRWNFNLLEYAFNVANGTWNIVLRWAELFSAIGNGGRWFNVDINGQRVLTNFGIWEMSGAKTFAAVNRTFQVNVTDGRIVISLRAVRENPTINGIELIPITTVGPEPPPPPPPNPEPQPGVTTRIKSTIIEIDDQDVTEAALLADTRITYAANTQISTGNVTLLGPPPENAPRWDFAHWDQAIYSFDFRVLSRILIYSGERPTLAIWEPDRGYTPASPQSEAIFIDMNTGIANTTQPALYQGARWIRNGQGQSLTWQFTVPNGAYQVTLKWAEFVIGSAFPDTATRLMNVYLNNSLVDSGVNIQVRAGGLRIAYDKTYPLNVTTGYVQVRLTSTQGNPLLNALEITGPAGFTPIRISAGDYVGYWAWDAPPDTIVLFNGIITQITMKDTDAKIVTTRYELSLNDWSISLDRAIIYFAVYGQFPPGGEFPRDDGDFIVRMLLERVAHVNTRTVIGGHQLTALDYVGKSIRQVLDDIADLTLSTWYVDQLGQLHYYPSAHAPDAPFAVSTEADMVTTFPFRMDSFTIDFQSPINDVWVASEASWFWQQPQTALIVHRSDEVSVAAYGRWSFGVRDASIKTEAEADQRARALLNSNAYPLEKGQFTMWSTHGIMPGQLIRITDSFMGVSGSWLVQQVSLQWKAKDIVEYTIQFGSPVVRLDVFLRALDVRTRTVSPVLGAPGT